MNTIKEAEFDYKRFMKEGPIDRSKINTGPMAHRNRRKAAKNRITIRIDEETIEQFKKLVPEGRGYQSLINLALREWLTAQGVQQLVEDKISKVVDQAVVSIQAAAQSPK